MKITNDVKNQEVLAPAPKRRHCWWIPAIIVLGATANIVRLQTSGELDQMFRNMQTFLTVMVSSGLVVVWFLFLSGLRWRTRLAGLGLLVLCLVGAKQLVRIDGSFNGGGKPRIVFKW